MKKWWEWELNRRNDYYPNVVNFSCFAPPGWNNHSLLGAFYCQCQYIDQSCNLIEIEYPILHKVAVNIVQSKIICQYISNTSMERIFVTGSTSLNNGKMMTLSRLLVINDDDIDNSAVDVSGCSWWSSQGLSPDDINPTQHIVTHTYQNTKKILTICDDKPLRRNRSLS